MLSSAAALANGQPEFLIHLGLLVDYFCFQVLCKLLNWYSCISVSNEGKLWKGDVGQPAWTLAIYSIEIEKVMHLYCETNNSINLSCVTKFFFCIFIYICFLAPTFQDEILLYFFPFSSFCLSISLLSHAM